MEVPEVDVGVGLIGVFVCGEVWVDGPPLARCGVMTSMSELLDGLLARHPTVHRNAVPWAAVTRRVRTPSEFLDWFGVPDSQSGTKPGLCRDKLSRSTCLGVCMTLYILLFGFSRLRQRGWPQALFRQQGVTITWSKGALFVSCCEP